MNENIDLCSCSAEWNSYNVAQIQNVNHLDKKNRVQLFNM